MKKRWKMIGVVCAIAILSAGCKSKESEAPTPSSTQDVPAEKTNAVITMEQVYEWDPDVIVITNFTQAKPDDLYNNAIGSDDWSNVSAVKNKRVYKMPLGTYRTYTPSVDSPMTLEWLAQAVYPKLFKDMDVKADVKEYYQNLFGVTLTDQQVDQMYTPNASASSMN